MMMIEAKGIPVGTPILDDAAVWTPPTIGPRDGEHLWLAHSLLGVSGATDTLPDMIGSLDLKAGVKGLAVSGQYPVFQVTSGDQTPIRNVSSDAPKPKTFLVVVKVDTKGDSATAGVPGAYLQIYKEAVYVATSVSSFGFFLDGGRGENINVFVVRVASASSVDIWCNSKPLRAGNSASGYSPPNRFALGSPAPYTGGSFSESFGALKTWERALSDDEVAAASVDAMRLFGIR